MQIKQALKARINDMHIKNWSAPALFATLIFFSMLLIFSFEAIGLTNRENNLVSRRIVIKSNIENKSVANDSAIACMDKAQKIEKINNILYESVRLQQELENINFNNINDSLEDIEFFQI